MVCDHTGKPAVFSGEIPKPVRGGGVVGAACALSTLPPSGTATSGASGQFLV